MRYLLKTTKHQFHWYPLDWIWKKQIQIKASIGFCKWTFHTVGHFLAGHHLCLDYENVGETRKKISFFVAIDRIFLHPADQKILRGLWTHTVQQVRVLKQLLFIETAAALCDLNLRLRLVSVRSHRAADCLRSHNKPTLSAAVKHMNKTRRDSVR